jgi:tetratricopeptide (TPR) repeat protein
VVSNSEPQNRNAKNLQKAEELGDKDLHLQLYWADYYIRKGDLDTAFVKCNHVLQSTKDKGLLTEAYNYLILGNKAYQNYAKVDEYYNKLFKLYPKDAQRRFDYAGFLLVTVGDYDKAIKYASQAAHLNNVWLFRQMWAMSLYAKWADLLTNKKATDAAAQKYFSRAHTIYPETNQIMAEAAIHPELITLIKALEAKGVSIDAPDYDGSTALIIAANRGNGQAVKMLLDLGADPNAMARNGWRAIFGAIDRNDIEMTKLLLAKGANPHLNYNGLEPATYAFRSNHSELGQVIQDSAAQTP